MKRRSFLRGAAAGGAIGVLDWLGFFRSFGVPGTQSGPIVAWVIETIFERLRTESSVGPKGDARANAPRPVRTKRS